ncbi:hypothetical protein [Aestuariibaculum suncheonense]|uniref:Uncharacterized protein n=1 Tax=Aestuariibaculum suncheonense TaxID=1028745 RepID=A0A8J6UI09_9FLAO|nr:hypothetical protein [Aestuariibaculum suncheonense]MBD0836144.1 hypothetical protein [Aestuariibaculum suncheonense]
MARTDFEKYMKEKLENRSMKPSPEAWNSLSKRLDENENASSNKTYWWLGIAAGFIGILFTVSLFFKTNEVVPVIVNNPVKTVEEVQKDTLKNDVKKAVKPVEEFMEIKQNAILPKQEEPIEIVQEQPIITEEEQNANNQIKKELSFEDQKVKEVIAKVNDLMTQNKEVTDDDIEALLLEAQRGINKQRIINQSTGVVDADALLQDVETELDQSFRSKVFEAIKTSFGTVKTAVAQRNQ